jgi:hypothetical protein
VEGLHIRGFILDGQGNTNSLINVSGRCPGLALEDVELRGFTQRAVRLSGGSGTRDRPLSLLSVRFVATEGSEASLFLEGVAGRPNQHVRATDCRFEGPCRAAVLLAGPSVGVRLERCRFFQSGVGVLYRKAQPHHRVELTITSSTFCDVQKGLDFEVPPPDAGRVAVENCLFARTGQTARVAPANGKTPPPRGPWVWKDNFRDGTSGESTLAFLAAPIKQFKLSADPASDRDFLRYPSGSPLAVAGTNGTPAGVPPLDE